jgi:hypothetical protein
MFQFLKYKSILSYILTVIIVFLWVSVVFWSDLVFDAKISKIEKISNNIFIDSTNLRNNLIIYTSSTDLSWYSLRTWCKIDYKFITNKLDKYYFQVKYDKSCLNPILFLENKTNWSILPSSKVRLNIFSKSKVFELFSDLDDAWLLKIKEKLEKQTRQKEKLKLYGFIKIKNKRLIQENKYKLSIINEILFLRKQKYLTPVSWVKLPHKYSKIPNSARPYRASYTDWIHHWWDFDTEFRHDVRAIDSGVIVRVISDFKFDDLNKIKSSKNLSYEDKLNNLDILRWNQIWLKTASGDVAFYSHLDYINPDIKVWKFVNKWEIIWKVWITWVPDKNYKDYHMHLPIHKNPHIKSKVWKYNLEDYMHWDWYYKGKSFDYILQHQTELFQN